MDFTKLPLKQNLVAKIKSGKLSYGKFAKDFLRIRSKKTKTLKDYQFLRDSIEVFKEDPKSFPSPLIAKK